MYFAIILILLVGGLLLVSTGVNKKRRTLTGLGIAVWILTALVFGSLSFLAEMLWFGELGFRWRFWTVILSKVGLGMAGGAAGLLLLFLLTLPIPRSKKISRIWPEVLGTVLGALIGFNSWEVVLTFANRLPGDMVDPILGKDIGFYLFSLPFYDLLYHALFFLVSIGLAAALAAAFLRVRGDEVEIEIPDLGKVYRPVYISLAIMIFIFAWGQYLNRFHLMNSQLGVVTGPGWTDVNIRMPGFLIVEIVSVICGIILLVSPLRAAIADLVGKRKLTARTENRLSGHAPALATVVVPPMIIAATWVIALVFTPRLAQWLSVEPNEITKEQEYIGHNIDFTRYAFGMQAMEERQFEASSQLSRELIDANRDLMDEVRLWDWRALAEVYEQFQEIRLYYTFPDVDIDRYTIGNRYRQVMISPREMDVSNLPTDSQTFVNMRFKYTHGYGLTMSTVRDFTPEGLPNLLIKNIPPQSEHPSLEVKQPQLYYGMLTDTPVVVNTKEKEFDYPSGDKNVYTRYQGHGGVQLSNLWRKFIFGWIFDGTRFLLSGYPTRESRVLFRRQVLDRARRLAPFLTFETDPYIVLNKGRLFWIIDAYTKSSRFPYSEPFSAREMVGSVRNRWNQPLAQRVGSQFEGANYIRNSVKVVIDAYDGDVSFYVFDATDPLIGVWQKIFPHLFKAKDDMPKGLRAHVRYPETLLLTQGLVYTKYHMTDPAVFYNQEDLWVRATEKYYQQVQPVEPYYVMWKRPGSDDPQFVLMLPFTPKNKQVMIGWMAALCDGDNYGRLLAYKFPKEKRILGPQQVETKIDQDRHLSGQLTLWDQRGSKVIRGNVLAIPIEDTLLYVEPIYLQAETAAYPELRLVAVMHGDNLSYAQTFDEALEGLFTSGATPPETDNTTGTLPATETPQLIDQAGQAFDSYLRLQAEKRFAEAAAELERLQDALERLANTTDD